MGNKLSFNLFCTDHFDSPDVYQGKFSFFKYQNILSSVVKNQTSA